MAGGWEKQVRNETEIVEGILLLQYVKTIIHDGEKYYGFLVKVFCKTFKSTELEF